MSTYIVIDSACTDAAGVPSESHVEVYETNTDEEIAAARAALREAGLEYAEEYAGVPDGLGDAYANGNKLFAEQA
jgi:hypothetical protein